MGDPAGIGGEILLKVFLKESPRNILVIGNFKYLWEVKKRFSLPLSLRGIEKWDEFSPQESILQILDLPNLPSPIRWGKIDPLYGKASYDYLLTACNLLKEKKACGVVTLPVCKQAINLAGIKFPGHTEILAENFGVKNFLMLLAGGKLRVALLTRHLPLSQVPKEVKKDKILRALRLLHHYSPLFGIEKPLIGVCGLNPHAGEGGVLGKEENQEITPAIREAKGKGINVEGPYPSDIIFRQREKFDFILAMYHDQGLIPLKTLYMEKGVNITLGLPFIRTSPDHGTAMDIAGRGTANPESFREALKLAKRLSTNFPLSTLPEE